MLIRSIACFGLLGLPAVAQPGPAAPRIAKLSPTRDTLAQGGTDGRGSGQFHRPGAVALDSAGNIYVADSGNDRIVMTVDGAGQLYVGDTSSNRVQRLKPMVVPLPDPAAE